MTYLLEYKSANTVKPNSR